MELFPCPYCGGMPEIDSAITSTFESWAVLCSSCYAEISGRKSRKQVIEDWNKRIGLGPKIMSLKYIEVDGKPQPCDNLEEWGQWFENTANRKVRETLIGPFRVSTIFLGLDHSHDETGPPLFYETLVFDLVYKSDLESQTMRRYATREKAIHGHDDEVKKIRDGSQWPPQQQGQR